MSETSSPRWLLLFHQIPPRPSYLRVKIWRQLQRMGAVAVKNSVYVLPRQEGTHENLQWLVQEIMTGGGDASLCEASFLEGLSDPQVERLFHAARDADYAALTAEAQGALSRQPDRGARPDELLAVLEADLARLRRRLAEVVAIDYLEAPGRSAAERALATLEARLRPPAAAAALATGVLSRKELTGRTWVTRKGIHVDRMASAWLIARFIDPRPTFRFVSPRGYRPRPGELRFDMFEAEFTHVGEMCTFEVLLARVGLEDPALRPLAEMVHDIDLKDQRYDRAETPGIERLIAGIAMAHAEDEVRLARSSAVFDDLHEYYRRKRA